MTDPNANPSLPALQAEIARLNKVVQVLMDRVEHSGDLGNSYFDQVQATVMLEDLVRRRTQELEAALAENRAINRALSEAEQKFHCVLDQSLVGISMTIDQRFHYANPKFAEILGYSVEEILKLGPADITPAEDLPQVLDVIRRALNGEFQQLTFTTRAVRKDGRIINVEMSGKAPLDIGGRPALIAVWADITERLGAEREIEALQTRLRDQALHDALTGLYNRLFLAENLDRTIALATRHGYPVSAVIADLDFFKSVNDRYGHPGGDAALKHLADLMRQHARSSDIICRYGGEEFLLLMPDTPVEVARERAEYLRQCLAEQRVAWKSTPIALTASFGVASYPEDAQSGGELIEAADSALYASKANGRNRVTRFGQSWEPAPI
ncbi:diguanylate cyclase [Methylococcaceae bacterium WWC4]|nr:diguanylate cyclase [Methylococcaceae bacterium WWC4]